MLDLIPLEVASCPDCGGALSLGERLTDTLYEDRRRYSCLGGHRGTLALTVSPHRDHPREVVLFDPGHPWEGA